jgi:hypothetical protein
LRSLVAFLLVIPAKAGIALQAIFSLSSTTGITIASISNPFV